MAKRLKTQLLLSIVAAVLVLVSLTTVTLAWFTNRPDMNVIPVEGKIGSSGGSLLICNKPDGVFGRQCRLEGTDEMAKLSPISTCNLTDFFLPGDQSPDDRIVSYLPGNDYVDEYTLHGHFYLKAINEDVAVYFNPDRLDFGGDIQAMASTRLGLRIRTQGNPAQDYIFRLDEPKNAEGAAIKDTIEDKYKGMVVSSVSGKQFTMVPDPAVAMSDYYADKDEEGMIAGENSLCIIEVDTVADVEYWLYLEGCDENCFNEVQLRHVALQLAFFGDMQE